MEGVKSQSPLGAPGDIVRYGKWTFVNASDRLQTATDPAEVQRFRDNCAVFNPTAGE